MKSIKISSAAFLLIALFSQGGLSFPEFSRHGYTSCTACHVSPNGGGVLTEYGRNLSKELISTWGTAREAEVGHGLLPKELADQIEHSKLRLGGSVRSVQTHRENAQSRRGDFFLMQLNAQVAWNDDRWAVVMNLGTIEDPRGSKTVTINSNQHYGLLRFDDSAGLRVGRFSPAFGLHLVDHKLSVRQSLGLGPEPEKHAIEFSWLGEQHQGFATIARTDVRTFDSSSVDAEGVAAFRYEYVFPRFSRIGTSLWIGESGPGDINTIYRRQIGSVHGTAVISEDCFFIGEYDHQIQNESRTSSLIVTNSDFSFVRVQYEPIRGIAALIQHQYEFRESTTGATALNKFGIGFHFFPRPHFEIFGVWNRIQQNSIWSDDAYLLFHYYI